MASESVLREKLATCVRIMNMQGLFGLFGHVSTYQPGKGRIFFSPSKGVDKSVVKPDDMVVADLNGKILDGKGNVPKSGPFIRLFIKLERMRWRWRTSIRPIPPCLPLSSLRFGLLRFRAPYSVMAFLYSRNRV